MLNLTILIRLTNAIKKQSNLFLYVNDFETIWEIV